MLALMLSLSGTVFGLPWLHGTDVRNGDLMATRRGETIAGTIVIGSGLLLALASDSRSPFIYGILLTAVYCAGIEYTVRQNASA